MCLAAPHGQRHFCLRGVEQGIRVGKGDPVVGAEGIRRRLQVDCTAGMAASAIIFQSHLAAHPASLGEAATA
jgi:hypothetical protein